MYEVASCVRGHHNYMRVWTPVLGEELKCQIEEVNVEDRYAVAVLKEIIVVGHHVQGGMKKYSQFLI